MLSILRLTRHAGSLPVDPLHNAQRTFKHLTCPPIIFAEVRFASARVQCTQYTRASHAEYYSLNARVCV